MILRKIEMTPEQEALFIREYAEHKLKESLSKTDIERYQESAVCAQLEKLAYVLGLSQTCLSKALNESTIIH